MQISSRFTIAIHIFACIAIFKEEYKITSKFLAGSINVNPVIIRQILLMLKSGGLINSKQGSSKIEIVKNPENITLLDIFNAVESIENKKLFSFHENPSSDCPVGRNIHNILDDKLTAIQASLEKKLNEITLNDIFESAKYYVESN